MHNSNFWKLHPYIQSIILSFQNLKLDSYSATSKTPVQVIETKITEFHDRVAILDPPFWILKFFTKYPQFLKELSPREEIKKYKQIELLKIQLLFLKYFLVQHDYYEKKYKRYFLNNLKPMFQKIEIAIFR